jgi:hypothetical protein
MDRLKSLDAEVEAIERSLAEAPRDVPDVHPNVAELYRRKVERLVEALNNPADRTEAATALRALIEKVVVTPTGRRGEVDVRLFGDLETVLAWAEDKEVGFRSPATLFLRAAGDGLSVPASDRSSAYPPQSPGQMEMSAFALDGDIRSHRGLGRTRNYPHSGS